jgi:hypothetical protein
MIDGGGAVVQARMLHSIWRSCMLHVGPRFVFLSMQQAVYMLREPLVHEGEGAGGGSWIERCF